MYTYVQPQGKKYGHVITYGRGLERVLTHIYRRPGLVYMERQRTAATASCSSGSEPAGLERRNSVLFIRRQPTVSECVVFIGSQPARTKQLIKMRHGVLQNGGNDLLFDRPRLKRDLFHREGSGIPQNGGNRLVFECLRSKRGPVDREGCGIPQNRGNGLVLVCYS